MAKKINAKITPRLAELMAEVDTDEKFYERKALVADAFSDLITSLVNCGGCLDGAGLALYHLGMYVKVLDELYLCEPACSLESVFE